MIANPNPLKQDSGQDFFVLPAYPQLATAHSEETMLADPYCQAFIEAMAAILVYLTQQHDNQEAGNHPPI